MRRYEEYKGKRRVHYSALEGISIHPKYKSYAHRVFIRQAFEKDPVQLCYWCHKQVFKAKGAHQVHNTATVDHLYSKFDIRRLIADERDIMVVSCQNCNWKRGCQEANRIKHLVPLQFLNLIESVKWGKLRIISIN